jgi:cell division protein ZapA
MGQVTVHVNDKAYTISCGDGEEPHLKELAAAVNQHVTDLANEVGQVGEARLLLMASLLISDELSDALQKSRMLEEEIEKLSGARASAEERSSESENAIAEVLDGAAKRIEELSKRIEAA